MSPPRHAIWQRALFGPMPLARPIAAVCIGLYVLAAALTALMTAPQGSIGQAFWRPSEDILYTLGMGGRVPLLEGRIWTLFTAPYLHGSLLHLAVNLFSLVQIMPIVERAFGRPRAFLIYLIAGLAGSVVSAAWGEAFSLGASGAILGLFGATVLYGAKRGDAAGRALMANAAIWAGIVFLYGLLNTGVSNAGHFGGFLGGLGAAMLITRRAAPFREPGRIGFVLASLTLLSLSLGLGNSVSLAWQIGSDRDGFLARRLDTLQDRVDRVLAGDPANADALVLRATILAQRDDYAAALRDVDLAIKGGRDSAVTRNLRAWSLFKLGRAEEGLPDAELALKAEPNDPAILDTRAHIYEAMGRRTEAIADYKAALRQDPSIAESQAGLRRLTSGD